MPYIDWSRDENQPDGFVVVEESGLVYTLTSHYFKAYNDRFMTSFTDKMRSMQMEPYCSSQDVSTLFTTHLCLGQQTMTNYSVKEENSRLWIDAESR